ncbi:hypothetical protein [Hanstruepera marina]|uniref:hypothetical protein n=1 Tax=Hanstruepera marina TaxID=2873265 RepID=UPI001CA7B25F|nr:hypothetical protein [Hanstruepera marina]
MIEFLNKHSSTLFFILEFIAAFTGVILYKKYRFTKAKYFIYFLIYVVAFVFVGKYSHYVRNNGFLSFLEGTFIEKNYWWFTIFWDIGGTIFFGWYYHNILEERRSKLILKISVYVFVIISLLEIVFTFPKFFLTSMPIITLTSAIIILQCVFLYFLEILQSERILYFYKSLGFYISCAILILWLIQTPLVFFEHYFNLEDADYVNLRNRINLTAITFMYITYTVGLIVSNPDYD